MLLFCDLFTLRLIDFTLYLLFSDSAVPVHLVVSILVWLWCLIFVGSGAASSCGTRPSARRRCCERRRAERSIMKRRMRAVRENVPIRRTGRSTKRPAWHGADRADGRARPHSGHVASGQYRSRIAPLRTYGGDLPRSWRAGRRSPSNNSRLYEQDNA